MIKTILGLLAFVAGSVGFLSLTVALIAATEPKYTDQVFGWAVLAAAGLFSSVCLAYFCEQCPSR